MLIGQMPVGQLLIGKMPVGLSVSFAAKLRSVRQLFFDQKAWNLVAQNLKLSE